MILHALADDFNLTALGFDTIAASTSIAYTLLDQIQDTLVDQNGDELYIPELGSVAYSLSALPDDFTLNAE